MAVLTSQLSGLLRFLGIIPNDFADLFTALCFSPDLLTVPRSLQLCSFSSVPPAEAHPPHLSQCPQPSLWAQLQDLLGISQEGSFLFLDPIFAIFGFKGPFMKTIINR